MTQPPTLARCDAQTRRRFLVQATQLGSLACLAVLPGCSTLSGRRKVSRPVVGTQLYGWGQYYQRENKDLNANLGDALSAIRDCGYDYAEGSLDPGRPEASLRFAEMLRERGMRPISLYSGGRLHEAGKAEANVQGILAAAKPAEAAGFSILVCNPDPIGREKTDAELRVQSAALTQLGTGLKSIGMALAIHNHTPEMVNQAREFHSNLRTTAAGTVDFCFDVHWVYRGGLAPLDALHEYAGRVLTWHLRQSRGGPWWEDLSTGDIDYAAVAQFATSHRLPPRYTVELALEQGTKVTRSVVENHRRSRDYVRQVFGC